MTAARGAAYGSAGGLAPSKARMGMRPEGTRRTHGGMGATQRSIALTLAPRVAAASL